MDREAEDGDVPAFGGGAVVAAAPGHTGGWIALHPPGPSVLFTGDAVADVGRATPGVFSTDRARAVRSLRRLAALDVDAALFGHGAPITRGGPLAESGRCHHATLRCSAGRGGIFHATAFCHTGATTPGRSSDQSGTKELVGHSKGKFYTGKVHPALTCFFVSDGRKGNVRAPAR